MSFFTVDGISLQFGGLKAVDSVSFSVEKGEIFTIIGPNGAGKTSIFNLISRLYDPTSGKLFFEGRDITEVPAAPDRQARHRAHLPEHRAVRERHACWPICWSAGTATPRPQLWQDMLFLPVGAPRREGASPQGRGGDRVPRPRSPIATS